MRKIKIADEKFFAQSVNFNIFIKVLVDKLLNFKNFIFCGRVRTGKTLRVVLSYECQKLHNAGEHQIVCIFIAGVIRNDVLKNADCGVLKWGNIKNMNKILRMVF